METLAKSGERNEGMGLGKIEEEQLEGIIDERPRIRSRKRWF